MSRLTAILLLTALSACHRAGEDELQAKALMATKCSACHVIPGIATAHGHVGPSLTGISDRALLAGTIPNTPDNLRAFLLHPQKSAPGGAMPELSLTPHQADVIGRELSK
jgi:cytochrome c2